MVWLGIESMIIFIFHQDWLRWLCWYVVRYLVFHHYHTHVVENSILTTIPYVITVLQPWWYPFQTSFYYKIISYQDWSIMMISLFQPSWKTLFIMILIEWKICLCAFTTWSRFTCALSWRVQEENWTYANWMDLCGQMTNPKPSG